MTTVQKAIKLLEGNDFTVIHNPETNTFSYWKSPLRGGPLVNEQDFLKKTVEVAIRVLKSTNIRVNASGDGMKTPYELPTVYKVFFDGQNPAGGMDWTGSAVESIRWTKRVEACQVT